MLRIRGDHVERTCLNRSAWKNDSENPRQSGSLRPAFQERFSAHPVSILWMNALVKRFVWRNPPFRIEAKAGGNSPVTSRHSV